LTEVLSADAAGIARAAGLLRDGGLVAFGTETVYGLGADATNATAVAAVFAAKGRPAFNPLICHYADPAAAFADVVASPAAERLAEAFWPGPLTLVLPRRADSPVALLTGAGLDSLAVRVPAHPVASALLRAVGRPVAAPSANPSGRISPTIAAHVLDGLAGRIDAVLDSGPCAVGLESTVLDLTGPRPALLRPGGVTRERLEEVLSRVLLAGPRKLPLPLWEGAGGRGEAAPDSERRDPSPNLDPLHGSSPQGEGALPPAWAFVGDANGICGGPIDTLADTSGAPRSPGLLASHYAPALTLRTEATHVAADEALLAFGPPLAGAAVTFQLSAAADTTEAAANLFAGLRALDEAGARLGLHRIAAMPVPDSGVGMAINDRLRRAAAPRPPGCSG